MSEAERKDNGPDFSLGVSAADFPSSSLLRGHVGDDAVLLARSGEEYLAVGASCPHYGASLADGVLVDDTVRCPWHHACFSLRTGEAIRAPAFDALACWAVEQRDGKIFVTAKKTASSQSASERMVSLSRQPSQIVIVGGGAACFAAAEMLRRSGYQRSLLMLSADSDLPVDRPNLSKDYLAGTAPEEWVPLKPESWYRDHGIDLRLNTEVVNLHAGVREVELASGDRVPYDRLLLATGAEPVRLALPGANLDNVFTLRSLADCRRIIAAAQSGRRVAVIGASFIGLEVAAALRARNWRSMSLRRKSGPLNAFLGRSWETSFAVYTKSMGLFSILRTRLRRLKVPGCA
jgi:nitrite reductase/ring-hydroxylating ferredoxin subunit